MTTVPTGARPRRGRPRHRDSPRARARVRREPARAAGAPPVASQLTSVVEVDLTGTAPTDVLVTVATAAVRAAAAHPAWSGGVHLGVPAADGTTSAVVEDADELTDAALAARLHAGQHAEVEPTLLVVDTGNRGVLLDTPAVGPGRTAVLGVGAVVRRPVVRDTDGGEVIVARSMAYLSLSHDPEVLDAADAAGLLGSVQRVIEEGSA